MAWRFEPVDHDPFGPDVASPDPGTQFVNPAVSAAGEAIGSGARALGGIETRASEAAFGAAKGSAENAWSLFTLPGRVYSGETNPFSPEAISQTNALGLQLVTGGLPFAFSRGPEGAMGVAGAKLLPSTSTEVAQQRGLAPPFFSALQQAVEKSGTAKASPEQWMSTLKQTPGVKKEEIEWSQVGDWLKGHDGPVGREQLADYLAKNRIRVDEVEAAGPEVERTYKFYTMPGGANYRELRLSIPETAEAQRTRELYSQIQHHRSEEGDFGDLTNEMRRLIGLPPIVEEPVPVPTSVAADRAKIEEAYGKLPKQFTEDVGSHWPEPGVVAHARVLDRVIDGKKYLAADEIQSIWHSKGHAQGYAKEPLSDEQQAELENRALPVDDKLERFADKNQMSYVSKEDQKKVYDSALKAGVVTPDELRPLQEYHDRLRSSYSPIPDAPFKSSWPELVMKRLVKYAADNGYDGVAWTTGAVQNRRWKDNIKNYERFPYQYDQVLVNAANKVGKKWGARVQMAPITDWKDEPVPMAGSQRLERMFEQRMITPEEVPSKFHRFDIPEEMRKAAQERGFPLFELGAGVGLAGAGANALVSQPGPQSNQMMPPWI